MHRNNFCQQNYPEWETLRQARKTTPDNVYCTSMTKALQQPQIAAAFVKFMGIP